MNEWSGCINETWSCVQNKRVKEDTEIRATHYGPGQLGGKAKMKWWSVEMYQYRETNLKIPERSGSLGRNSKMWYQM